MASDSEWSSCRSLQQLSSPSREGRLVGRLNMGLWSLPPPTLMRRALGAPLIFFVGCMALLQRMGYMALLLLVTDDAEFIARVEVMVRCNK